MRKVKNALGTEWKIIMTLYSEYLMNPFLILLRLFVKPFRWTK